MGWVEPFQTTTSTISILPTSPDPSRCPSPTLSPTLLTLASLSIEIFSTHHICLPPPLPDYPGLSFFTSPPPLSWKPFLFFKRRLRHPI
ncbi:hypothetical protein CF327_g3618 [Tilletia walkeri]|nr:hypothetical protein CF327_g3618 [Tilletia walkeri]